MQSIEQNACSPARQRTFASPARHEQLSTSSDISKPIVEAGGRLVIENYMSDNDDDDSMIVDKKTHKQNGKKKVNVQVKPEYNCLMNGMMRVILVLKRRNHKKVMWGRKVRVKKADNCPTKQVMTVKGHINI